MSSVRAGRARQLPQLVSLTVRAVRWGAPLIAVTLVGGLLIVFRDQLDHPATAITMVRIAGLLLAVGALTLMDDPARGQVASAPLPLAWRSAPRLVAAAIGVLGPIAVLAGRTGLPVDGVIVEVAAVLILGSACCLLLGRTVDYREPSVPVGAAILLIGPALALLPASLALVVPPGDAWDGAHLRWLMLLGLCLIAWAYAVRDPAGRLLHPPDRGAHPSNGATRSG